MSARGKARKRQVVTGEKYQRALQHVRGECLSCLAGKSCEGCAKEPCWHCKGGKVTLLSATHTGKSPTEYQDLLVRPSPGTTVWSEWKPGEKITINVKHGCKLTEAQIYEFVQLGICPKCGGRA